LSSKPFIFTNIYLFCKFSLYCWKVLNVSCSQWRQQRASHDVFAIGDAAANDNFDLILYYSHISSVSHQSILLARCSFIPLIELLSSPTAWKERSSDVNGHKCLCHSRNSRKCAGSPRLFSSFSISRERQKIVALISSNTVTKDDISAVKLHSLKRINVIL
uniref:Uncharacterized protein n=1 Tax=Parascaris univalens TaxID=6257 RepID=A0A915ABV9_PARUN